MHRGLHVRVLVVDDTPVIRAVVRRTLERDERFDIVGEAPDGCEAVAMAEQLQPDLVLLDLAMPRMDGLEALPLIQRVAPETRVIVLSGFSPEHMGEAAMASGAVGYIEKNRVAITLVPSIVEVFASLLRDL